MATATQEFVQGRVAPLEMAVQNLTAKLDELSNKLISRDADMESSEKRYEEIAKAVEKFGLEIKELTAGGFAQGSDAGRTKGFDDLMKSPALRNVVPKYLMVLISFQENF